MKIKSKKKILEVYKKTNLNSHLKCQNFIWLKKTIKSSSKKKNQNNSKYIRLDKEIIIKF